MALGAASRKKRTLVSIADEVDGYATIPNPAPTLVDILETNDTLKPVPQYERSQYRRSDRNRPGSFLAGFNVAGSLGIQLPYGHYDSVWEKLFYSSGWSSSEEHISSDTTISFESIATSSSSYAKILDSANGMANYDAGSVIEVETASGTNDGVYKLYSAAAGELEILYDDFTDENAATAGATTIHQFADIENGVTCNSFLLERHYSDQSSNPSFSRILGLLANESEITIAPRQLIRGSFNLVGSTYAKATTTMGDGSNTVHPTDISMNAIQHINSVRLGGEVLDFRQITMRMANGNEPLEKIGQLGPFDYAEDDCAVSGEIQAYFTSGTVSSATEFAKALAGTASSLWVPMVDAAGNQYVWDVPTLKFSDADESPGDTGTGAIIVRLPFEAEVTVSEAMTMRLARRAAA